MIVITGATGKLGGAIVQRLLKQVPPDKIGVSVRDPAKAEHFASQGVRVRQGDFSDSKSLQHSMEGATSVLIISANSLEHGVKFNTTAIDAAKACGAKRILYTSHQGSSSTSHFPPMRTHAATENYLKSLSGVQFTALRNGFYADATARFLASAQKEGKIVAPEDGPMSWTTHADLADAAVAALLDESLIGVTAPLTASESLDLNQIAKIASEALGKKVERVTVSDAEYRKTLTFLPDPVADMFLGMFVASRNREFDVVDGFLGKLIGRPTTSFRKYVSDEFQKSEAESK